MRNNEKNLHSYIPLSFYCFCVSFKKSFFSSPLGLPRRVVKLAKLRVLLIVHHVTAPCGHLLAYNCLEDYVKLL